jgi:hypothetical protein
MSGVQIKRKVEGNPVKKPTKVPLGPFNAILGARGYFDNYGKMRREFNEKGILFLIDEDIPAPSQAHIRVTFKRTEAIIAIVIGNWEYICKQAAEDAPALARQRAMEFLDNRLDAYKWNRSAEEQDIAFCDKILALLNPVYF